MTILCSSQTTLDRKDGVPGSQLFCFLQLSGARFCLSEREELRSLRSLLRLCSHFGRGIRYAACRRRHNTLQQSGHRYLDVLRLGVLFSWVVLGHFHWHVQVGSQQTLRNGRKQGIRTR